MSGDKRSGIETHLHGTLRTLLIGGVGTVSTAVLAWLWPIVFHRNPPIWAASVLGIAVVALLLVANYLVRKVYRRLSRTTPKARGDRLSIYVAELGEDKESRDAREHVFQSIQDVLGSDYVEVLPAAVCYRLAEGVNAEQAVLKPVRQARDLLRKKGGELLLWGKLFKKAEEPKIELRFVSLDEGAAAGERKIYGLESTLVLDATFGTEMGAALAAMAAVAAAQAVPALGSQGNYVAAILIPVAERLGKLVRALPASFRGADRARLFFSYASVQLVVGEQAGDSSRLQEAVAAYREALKERTRERLPLNWAMTQNNLGTALARLGERDCGTKQLEEAVRAYREALEEYTRERMPLDWARTQNNLGNALARLGERESGTKQLEEAVRAYREALEERTRERVPLNWARTQNNLGIALMRLGERENGTKQLEEAVRAYREALEECTRERVPLNWAMTQNNLGTALARLGEREGGTKRLEEAVRVYRVALEERTRERVPLDWAMTQNNLGTALGRLGERESGTERLEEAVRAIREALKERTRERVPLDWAETQNNLGTALMRLGERESGTERLEEAVAAYQNALEAFQAGGATFYQPGAKSGLERAQKLLEERRGRESGEG